MELPRKGMGGAEMSRRYAPNGPAVETPGGKFRTGVSTSPADEVGGVKISQIPVMGTRPSGAILPDIRDKKVAALVEECSLVTGAAMEVGVAAPKKGRGRPASETHPWDEYGLSRRKYFRLKKAGTLPEKKAGAEK